MGQLDGKVAVVTGAAQGIGRALADGLAAEGARIVVADLRGAEEAAAAYPDGVGLTVDVADEGDVARLVDETLDRCGGLDVLVNNAGLYASLEMRAFTEIPLEEWRTVMDVNVASMFLTCRAAVPVMRAAGGGTIVNISSGTPFRGVPFLLHYVTSKGAIVAFTRALARELGKDGIRVNCVAPGFTMSEGVKQNPEVIEKLRDVSVSARTIQRDQEPEDVVGAVTYLAGRRRRSSPARRSSSTAASTSIEALALPLRDRGRDDRRQSRRLRPRARRGAVRRGRGRRAALVWQLDHDEREADGALLSRFVQLDPFAEWVVRCDRVDFPLGGIAHLHTHPGPGIRYLLAGELEVETEGHARFYGPGGAWFESGPEPVVARASAHLETSFVRVLVLPAEWAGKRTIRYVERVDELAPKQTASILLEHAIALPR